MSTIPIPCDPIYYPTDGHKHPASDICAPGGTGGDKEIIFNEGGCLASDPNFLWDYTAELLTVNGDIASSGYISSSSQIEGAYLAPLALGTGALNFTPPSGYGGLIYRGGSVFLYWDNLLNSWQQVDFSSGGSEGQYVLTSTQIIAGTGLSGGGPLTSNVTLNVVAGTTPQLIYAASNGVLAGTARPVLNFINTGSVTWSVADNGAVLNISAFSVGGGGGGGGPWTEIQDANNFGIINLPSINNVPIANYLTTTWTQPVNANSQNLNNLNNVYVNGTLYYHGTPIENLLGLWGSNTDGSIYRNSNVYIHGSGNPLIITSLTNQNVCYLTTTGTGEWAAWAVEFDGAYGGELGFSRTVTELWVNTALIFRGFEADGHVYFPGYLGLGVSTPAYPLDVVGSVNATGCYKIDAVSFACSDGAGGIALSNITTINGGAPGGGGGGAGQTPWLSNIAGAGYSLSGVNLISANNYTATAGQGYTWSDSSWLVYSSAGNLYIRDVVNSRQALYFVPGPSGTGYAVLDEPISIGANPTIPPLYPLDVNGRIRSLNAAGTTNSGLISDGPSGANKAIRFQTNTLDRFVLFCDATPESGVNNAGSNLVLWNYNDPGAQLGTVFYISRSTGNVNINYGADGGYKLYVVGDINITGAYRINGTPLSTGGSQSPWVGNINGGGYSLSNVANITAGALYSTGTISSLGTISATGYYVVLPDSLNNGYIEFYGPGNTVRWTLYKSNAADVSGADGAGSDFELERYNNEGGYLSSPIFCSRLTGNVTIGGAGDRAAALAVADLAASGTSFTVITPNKSSGYAITCVNSAGQSNFAVSYQGWVWIGTGGAVPPGGGSFANLLTLSADSAVKPGTNTWAISSDIRTKENVRRFDGDINVIRQLDPIVAEYNGKAKTPKGARVVSFDPLELRKLCPQAVVSVSGEIDGEETDVLGVNTHEIFFHLLRAVQNIDKRLANLESSQRSEN